MSWIEAETAVAWGTVVIGALVSIADLWAVRYFWRERKHLRDNWVYRSTFDTVWQITLVCIVLTINRALFLATDFSALWMAIITGFMAIGLLAIPVRKMLEFMRHEGETPEEVKD